LTRDNAEMIIAEIVNYAEAMTCAFLRPPPDETVCHHRSDPNWEAYIDNRANTSNQMKKTGRTLVRFRAL